MASTTFLQQAYLAYFGRPADAAGLLTFGNDKVSEASVIASFSASAESQQFFGSMDPFAQINTIYKNLFNREAEPAGLNHWAGKIISGEVTLASAAMEILKNAQNSDKTAVTNKLAASAAFTAAIDTTAEIIGYAGAAAIAPARAFLAAVTSEAASLTAATAATALAASVTAVVSAGSSAPVGQAVALSDKIDNLTGTANNDTFMGSVGANNDTLQSDDVVNGGAGTDTLEVTLANTPFAITPRSNSVEVLRVRSQADGDDEGTNDVQGYSSPIFKNLTKTNEAGKGVSTIVTEKDNTIDAQNLVGTNQFWSTNSRADLVIEDVRNKSHETTLGFQSTDPGDVDYAVFFDPSHITAPGSSASGATLTIRLADVLGLKVDSNGLKNLPYSGLTLNVGGKAVALAIDFTKLTSYADFAKAINDALVAAGQTTITAAVGAAEKAVFSTTVGEYAIGTEAGTYNPIVLTNTGADAIKMSAYVSKPGVEASNGNEVRSATANEVSVVPSLDQVNIILDDVGRGSMAGDFLAGSMSTGVSGSKGIAQFNVAVDRNSHITTLQTTNNWLEVVNVTNIGAKGNLKLDDNNLTDKDYGLTDVRVFDAMAMTGKVTVSAVLSEKVVAKYMDRVDTKAPAADNSDPVAYRNVVDQEFSYDLGKADDALYLNISQDNMAASGTTNREDFVLEINGNAGNDAITVQIGDDGNAMGDEAWYTNSAINANLTINAGEGNDVVKANGAGNWKINTGAGNDTVYSDNSGAQKAVWVFNTAGQAALAGAVKTAVDAVAAATNPATLTLAQAALTAALEDPANAVDAANYAARQLNDLVSDNNDTVSLYKASVNVTYRGITVTQAITGTGTNQYKTDDLNINQAIKAAINKADSVLSKLLIAQDGPANTLIVTSLIDGENGDADAELALTFTTTATDAEALVAGYADKAAITANGAALAAGDYAAAYALNGLGYINGADSTNATDSTHNLGAGDDVLVLSTNHKNDGVTNATSSNETVVYNAIDFGKDTIVNFNTGHKAPFANFVVDTDVDDQGTNALVTDETLDQGQGEDKLDFTVLGGKTFIGKTDVLATAVNAIVVRAAVTTTLDDKGDVADLFDLTTNTADQKHVVVLVGSDNVGTVYQVSDAAGATAATAEAIGSIDLSDTPWLNLSADNFA